MITWKTYIIRLLKISLKRNSMMQYSYIQNWQRWTCRAYHEWKFHRHQGEKTWEEVWRHREMESLDATICKQSIWRINMKYCHGLSNFCKPCVIPDSVWKLKSKRSNIPNKFRTNPSDPECVRHDFKFVDPSGLSTFWPNCIQLSKLTHSRTPIAFLYPMETRFPCRFHSL